MARYEADYYHRVGEDVKNVPGNPWFITTLWLAQYFIARAKKQEDLARAKQLIEWVQRHAHPSGVLAEQVDPYDNAPLSVSPLTWSHAEFVITVREYLGKLHELGACPNCNKALATVVGSITVGPERK
jgi:GH15 family glucan-1,4-alpha-glucosidase